MNFVQKVSSLFSIQELLETFKRFPVTVACSVFLFVLGVGDIHEIWGLPRTIAAELYLSGVVAFFVSGMVHLMNESRGRAKQKSLISAILGAVIVAVLVFTTDTGEEERYFAMVFSSIALVLVAPFILQKSDDISVWNFARQVIFGVAISFIAALILFGGASGALASIGYLFDVKIDGDVYTTIWLFGAVLVAPLYALSFVPHLFDVSEQECHMPPQVGFIANWILAPLIAVYIAILYAYFIKMGVTGDVPKNQLAYMISGFAFAGIVTYLVAWPCVVSGKANKLLEGIMRGLFPLLLLPTLVMIYAIFVRIHEYGVTEKRYIIVVAALWFVFLITAFLAKRLQIKYIILSFAVLLFLATIGPWSMTPLSQGSQFHRLTDLLVKNEILKDNQIRKTEAEISFEDRKNISSKLNYLRRTKYYDQVLGWISQADKDAAKNEMTAHKELYPVDITKIMGFKFLHHYNTPQSQERFSIKGQARNALALNVRGYDFAVPTMRVYFNKRLTDKLKKYKHEQKKSTFEGKGMPKIVYFLDKKGMLMMNVEGRGQIAFDLQKFAKAQHNQNKPELTLERFGHGMKMRLVFQRISGKIIEDDYIVENVTFALLLDL